MVLLLLLGSCLNLETDPTRLTLQAAQLSLLLLQDSSTALPSSSLSLLHSPPSSIIMGVCYPLRPLTLIGLFFTFFPLILLIAATAHPEFGKHGLGAFHVCDSDDDACSRINRQCETDYGTIPDCSKYHAFQAFLLIGLLMSLFVTALDLFMFFAHHCNNRGLLFVSNVTMALQTFSLVVAFAVFTSWAHDYDWDKGSSFGLLVASWCLSLVGWVCWNLGCVYEVEGEGSRYPSSAPPATTMAAPSGVVVDKKMAAVPSAPVAAEPTVVSSHQHGEYPK